MTTVLLVLAWLLCGVLAALLDARWESRAVRLPFVPASVLGPISFLFVAEEALNRYAERHRRGK